MKAQLIQQPLLNSVFSDKNIEFIWNLYGTEEDEENGKEIFLDVNKKEFCKPVKEFFPQLTPFADFNLKLKDIKDRDEYLEVETGKLDCPLNFGSRIHLFGSKTGKTYEIKSTEYIRLVMIFVFPEPENFLNIPYRIIKLVSDPVKFMPGNKHNFKVILPSDYPMIADSCKEYYVYTFAYIFEHSLEPEEHGNEYMDEIIHSFSNTYYLTAFYNAKSPKPIPLHSKPPRPKQSRPKQSRPKQSRPKQSRPKQARPKAEGQKAVGQKAVGQKAVRQKAARPKPLRPKPSQPKQSRPKPARMKPDKHKLT